MQCSNCKSDIKCVDSKVVNFCSTCGVPLVKNCNCWVMGKLYNCFEDHCPGIDMAVKGLKTAKTKDEQMTFKFALLIEISRKLEWSGITSIPNTSKTVCCCPLCGGIHPKDYNLDILQIDLNYSNGHKEGCLLGLVRNS